LERGLSQAAALTETPAKGESFMNRSARQRLLRVETTRAPAAVPGYAPVSTVRDFQFAIGGFIGYLADMTVAESKFLKEAIKQGLRLQHRFLAEPVLARTGKGYMKSEGVATLQRIKASLKKSKSK
jgi:hypothetical protein